MVRIAGVRSAGGLPLLPLRARPITEKHSARSRDFRRTSNAMPTSIVPFAAGGTRRRSGSVRALVQQLQGSPAFSLRRVRALSNQTAAEMRTHDRHKWTQSAIRCECNRRALSKLG